MIHVVTWLQQRWEVCFALFAVATFFAGVAALRRVVLLQKHERAVVRLAGSKREDKVLGEGLHWLPRGAELLAFELRPSGAVARRAERVTVRSLDVRPRKLDVPPVALATRDAQHVLLDCSVSLRVTDPLLVVEQARRGHELLSLAERIVLHNAGVAASKLDAAKFIESVESNSLRDFLLNGLREVTTPLGFKVIAFSARVRVAAAASRRSVCLLSLARCYCSWYCVRVCVVIVSCCAQNCRRLTADELASAPKPPQQSIAVKSVVKRRNR